MRRWSPLLIGILLLVLVCAGLDGRAVKSANQEGQRREAEWQERHGQRAQQEQQELLAQRRREAEAAAATPPSEAEPPKQVVNPDYEPRSFWDDISDVAQMSVALYGRCRSEGMWGFRIRQAHQLRALERADLTPEEREVLEANVRYADRALVPTSARGVMGTTCDALGPDEPPPWVVSRGEHYVWD